MERLTWRSAHHRRCLSWAVGIMATSLVLTQARTLDAHGPAGLSAADAGIPRPMSVWADPISVSNTPDTNSDEPTLVVTDGGQVHVVWEEGAELYHSYRESGSWSVPSRVATGEQPSLATGSNHILHLAYVNEFGGVYDIYHTKWDGDSWEKPPHPVSDTDSFSDAPDLTVGNEGHLHVVWTEEEQIYYADSATGLTWSYSPIFDGVAPSVAVGDDGTLCLAWQNRDPTSYDVYVSELADGGWAPAQNVSDTPGVDSALPDLVVEAEGPSHLVWQEDVGGTIQVRYSQGPSWSLPTTVSDSGNGAFLPSLAVNAGGTRSVAWEDFAFPRYRIRYTRAARSGTDWTSPETLVESLSPSRLLEKVRLHPDGPGEIHAVWVAVEDGRGEIMYSLNRGSRVFLPLTLRSG